MWYYRLNICYLIFISKEKLMSRRYFVLTAFAAGILTFIVFLVCLLLGLDSFRVFNFQVIPTVALVLIPAYYTKQAAKKANWKFSLDFFDNSLIFTDSWKIVGLFFSCQAAYGLLILLTLCVGKVLG